MVSVLLSVTFACGLFIAVAHVINRRFVAPVYDVLANLTAFASAATASALLGHELPSALSLLAVGCWLLLGRRTWRAMAGARHRSGRAERPARPGEHHQPPRRSGQSGQVSQP